MRRVLAIVASGTLLASCSSSNWDFLKPSGDLFSSSPQAAVLRFESEPQGAEARLPNGQSCRTPCALSVPAQSSSVTFSLNGYLPQTVPVQVLLPEDTRMDSESVTAPQPRLNPNPVYAELQLAPPPTRKPPPRKPAPRPAQRPAAAPASAPAPAMQPSSQPASPWPAPQR